MGEVSGGCGPSNNDKSNNWLMCDAHEIAIYLILAGSGSSPKLHEPPLTTIFKGVMFVF
jgi:hypothetical protein